MLVKYIPDITYGCWVAGITSVKMFATIFFKWMSRGAGWFISFKTVPLWLYIPILAFLPMWKTSLVGIFLNSHNLCCHIVNLFSYLELVTSHCFIKLEQKITQSKVSKAESHRARSGKHGWCWNNVMLYFSANINLWWQTCEQEHCHGAETNCQFSCNVCSQFIKALQDHFMESVFILSSRNELAHQCHKELQLGMNHGFITIYPIQSVLHCNKNILYIVPRNWRWHRQQGRLCLQCCFILKEYCFPEERWQCGCWDLLWSVQACWLEMCYDLAYLKSCDLTALSLSAVGSLVSSEGAWGGAGSHV